MDDFQRCVAAYYILKVKVSESRDVPVQDMCCGRHRLPFFSQRNNFIIVFSFGFYFPPPYTVIIYALYMECIGYHYKKGKFCDRLKIPFRVFNGSLRFKS